MKKFYQHPHVEISEEFIEDILTSSSSWSDEQSNDFGGDDPYARANVF